MTVPNIVDPFFRSLYLKLSEEIEKRASVLVTGGSLIHSNIGIDPIATAIKYQSDVTYIETLQQVIELGLQLDHEKYGRRSNNNDDGDL